MGARIAFLTTIFPMKEDYLLDFFNSLDKQTHKTFDVIVVNDAYLNFAKIKAAYKNLEIIELPYSDSPIKNREHGVNYVLQNNYDIIVFGDSDDYFEDNRIEICISKLDQHDIVVNDLTLFGQDGIYSEKEAKEMKFDGTELMELLK